MNDAYALSDLVRFDDAFSLVVPPFLLQLLQFFALQQMKNGHVDATPAHDAPARAVNSTLSYTNTVPIQRRVQQFGLRCYRAVCMTFMRPQ